MQPCSSTPTPRAETDMSVVSENAIVISATLETTGVTNGVDRIKQSAAEIQAEFFKSAAASAPQYARAGEQAADGFLDGMAGKILKSMLIRDAFKFVLNGIKETFQDVQQGLEQALGNAGKEGFSVWRDAANDIKGIIHDVFPGFAGAQQGTVDAQIRAVEAGEQQRKEIAALKEHPEHLKTSPEALTSRLESLMEQAAKDQENNLRYRSNAAIQGSDFKSAGADLDDIHFADRKRENSQSQEYVKALLAIAEENKRKFDEAGRKQQAGSFKAANEGIDASDRMRGDERAESAKADAKAARDEAAAERKAKRLKELEISEEEHDLRGDRSKKDLDFTEKMLEHQRVTSVASIQGGLYGKSDSAAALVQHAAQQVSLLRSIDSEIKALRQEHTQLTMQ